MKGNWLYFIPGIVLCLASLWCGLSGYRVNLTSSMPLGIWKASTIDDQGGYATFCLPADSVGARMAGERGYLPSGTCSGGCAPLLKRIAAVAGDVVILTDETVCVNDTCLPNSRTLMRDSASRPLIHYPRGTYRVPAGEYWLLSTENERSYDSRYFGPVPESAVIGFLAPVATFKRQR